MCYFDNKQKLEFQYWGLRKPRDSNDYVIVNPISLNGDVTHPCRRRRPRRTGRGTRVNRTEPSLRRRDTPTSPRACTAWWTAAAI